MTSSLNLCWIHPALRFRVTDMLPCRLKDEILKERIVYNTLEGD